MVKKSIGRIGAPQGPTRHRDHVVETWLGCRPDECDLSGTLDAGQRIPGVSKKSNRDLAAAKTPQPERLLPARVADSH
jgi:hypothetical protein